MGAWDELDTEISVEVDTTELEDLKFLLETEDIDGIFDDAVDYVDKLITGIHEGSQEGVQDIAERNRSFQDQIISEACDNPSGMLASSIYAEEVDEYTYLVGTTINHIYPMALEFGRGPVYPIRAKALAFYAPSGELVFRKSAGPARPRPFVAPAFDRTSQIAEEIMLRKVNIAINRN
ncbi:MAG: hypothetical protein IJ258_05385 [Methanobrevibacter sp.]|uniref:hypothetical protein n=1 Tax=Methanobrevibacter sp. TaxID=66852 RepID=UPI0025D2BDE9|nr:hypothetical protein [Methanobrevibacter sp.]MBQ8017523.1 hypothetical protein [Methanobrevibacter sp.]